MNMKTQNLKENIKMEKEMEKEKNIIMMVYYYLKENIQMVKNGMEKEKNIILKVN